MRDRSGHRSHGSTEGLRISAISVSPSLHGLVHRGADHEGRTRHQRLLSVVCLLVHVTLAASLLAGCTSPESKRTRGGGPGADVGNRPEHVKMHEGSQPFWQTPDRIGVEHPPLDPARQAQRIATP